MEQEVENMNWYVLRVMGGKERKTVTFIEKEIDRLGMQDFVSQILVPTEKVYQIRNGKKVSKERNFFPGYVLVQMELSDVTWHMVRDVPRVLGFIGGTADKPAAITDAEAELILNRVEDGINKPKPKVLFEVGEVLRVVDGPFKDFDGVVEEVNYEKSRLTVTVMIFGRSTPVDLEFTQVEKG